MMPDPEESLCLGDEKVDEIRVHKKAKLMPNLPAGPFARLGNGDLLCVAGNPSQTHYSSDEGATWEARASFETDEFASAHTGALIRTKGGVIVLAFANVAAKHWTWSDDLKDAPGAILPTCAVRSVDNGKTWQDLQTLHEEWTGATRDIIQLSSGRVVFTSMKMLNNPGRHSVMCYFSDDEGISWKPSNVIDLGGNGHHGGVTEGSIVELKDGSLLQYIRTNWGQLWRAISTDGGEHWHPYGPSGIPASTTPPLLKRLASGRIALLWNRPYPAGQDSIELMGGDGIWSATPASNYRPELSLSFSEDECESWSQSVVIAKSEQEEGDRNPEVCYPYAFEPEPGTLWITAHRWDLRMSLLEEDFLR